MKVYQSTIKKKSLAAVVFLLIAVFKVSGDSGDPISKRPKLVIGVVVDQMRYDYLYRYQAGYGDKGFKRLLREGFSCENAHYDYVPTYTAPGHACVYTGTTPSDNGIISNDWYDRNSGRTVYCVSDSTVLPVGTTAPAGRMSPRRLLSSTLTDEIKFGTNYRSKVIGIALKDRGAILPAGHSADAAYWHDPSTNSWVSSSYYMNELPEWVKRFNERKLPDSLTASPWQLLFALNRYTQSSPDSNSYEGMYKGEKAPVFSHDLPEIRKKDPELLRRTPFGNTYTLEFAKAAIVSESLGKHQDVDLLAVSLSSTDYVGHQFGINALETEDTYYRLDRDLGAFLEFLDKVVGKGEYLLFLTADHGASANPEFNKDHGLSGGVVNESVAKDSLRNMLSKRFGTGDLLSYADAYGIYLDHQIAAEKHIDIREVEDYCSGFILGFPGVRSAFTANSLMDYQCHEGISRLVQRGYNRQRSADVCIQLEPGWIDWSVKTGTSHGSPYTYDTHVPLLFFGKGVRHGETVQQVSVCDIAPSVAALLKVQEPSATSGKPILHLFKK